MTVIIDGTTGIQVPDGSGSVPSYSNDGDGNTGLFFPAADTVAFATSGSEVARFDSSGRLGVGTTSPSSFSAAKGIALQGAYSTSNALAISCTGASATNQSRIGFYNGNSFGGDEQSAAIYAINPNAGTNNGGTLVFAVSSNGTATTPSERARITAGGYSKFSNAGTYQDTAGTYHELRSNAADIAVNIGNTNASTPYGAEIRFGGAAPNNTGQYFLVCVDTGATRAVIRANGGLANYQANNADLSDVRTKKEINPVASMWDKIGALEIVTYKYNDQTHDDVNVGVIAQQVEAVEPVWVDNDGFGETPEGEEPLKTVYTKDIYFAAIKALQEAMARIEQLEAKVAAAGL